jgi:Family of unknown function (DUF6065)
MNTQTENDGPVEIDDGRRTAIATASQILTAYRIPEYSSTLRIVPAPAERHWMDFTTHGWANRCLPLRIANQVGWHILNNCDFEAEWRGKEDLASVKITFKPGNSSQFVRSSFGFGILTWYLPYLFRTPPGYNLLVRGPSNYAKDGIAPLDGLVETDWAVAMFTVNWRFTRPFHKVKFECDEPICAIVPQRRGELESFEPEIRNLDGELRTEYNQWLQSRQHHVIEKEKHGYRGVHESHYTRGVTVTGHKAPEHQAKLALAPFLEREAPPVTLGASGALEASKIGSESVSAGSLRHWLKGLIGRRAG